MQKFVLGILVGATSLVVAGLSGCGDETCIQEAAASLDGSSGLARSSTGHTGAGLPGTHTAGDSHSAALSPLSAGSPLSAAASAIRGKGIDIDEPEASDGIPAATRSNHAEDALPEMEENAALKQAEVAQAQKASSVLAGMTKPAAAVLAAADGKKGENVPGLENFELGTDITLPEMPAAGSKKVEKSAEPTAAATAQAQSEPAPAVPAAKETVVVADAGKDAKKADRQWREEMLELVPAAPSAKPAGTPGVVTIAEEVSGEKVTVAPSVAPVADTVVAANNVVPVAVASVVKDVPEVQLPTAPVLQPAAEVKPVVIAAEDAAAAPAEAPKAEEAKPAEAVEAPAKVEEAKPAEAATAPAKVEEVKPAEAAAPVKAEEAKPVETAKPAEEDKKADLIKSEKIRREERLVSARNSYETGVKYFNAGQYQEALNFFEKAVQADPGLQDAVTMRTKARQLTGRTDNVEDDSQLMNEISRNQAARLRERELSINNSLRKATTYFVSATNPDGLRRTLPRNEQIKLGLEDLEQASKEAQAAEQLLQGAGLAKSAEATLVLQIKALKAQVADAGRSLVEERGMLDRREAQAKADAQKQSVTEEQAKELDQLFAAVDLCVQRMEYDKALEAVEKIIKMDPNNKKAYEKRAAIERENHQQSQIDISKDLQIAEDNWAVDIKDSKIMPKKLLIYPLDWERIQQRARERNSNGAVDFERQRIIGALSSVTGSVEYTELPLNLVMDDFRRRAKVNIMLNPEVDQNMPVTITLRDVSLWVAFEQILKANELDFSVKDQAIEIFKAGSGGSSDVVLKIFQVADLTTPKKNHYAPKISSGEEGTGWGDDDDDDDDDDEWDVKQTPLKEQVQKYVTPDKWSNDAYAVELWDDNLLVRATPEIIAQVSKFLDKIRESARLQVFVEGRFMDITDDFSELFGFDWTSAYSNSNSSGSKRVQGGVSINPLNTVDSFVSANSSNSGMHADIGGQWTENPLNYLLNTLNVNLVVDAIQTTKKGSVLHNPKVLVANGRNAYARVIVISRYMTSYSIVGTMLIPTMTELVQGVTWDVRPIVSFDRKYVTVRVRPRMEELDATNASLTNGNQTVTISDDEVDFIYTVNLMYPTVKQTLFETNATVPDGGTLLIGGQLQEENSESVTGIPVLTEIPYFGRAFRSNQKVRSGSNRVIMVSAKIVELED